MPSHRSQAHLQVAQAIAKPEPAKELAYPNARTDRKGVANLNKNDFEESTPGGNIIEFKAQLSPKNQAAD